MAFALDEAIRIPGTRIRLGLDPILGLIPGGGDAVAALLGSSILIEAARKGVPGKIIAKMLLNSSLNALAGAIPGLGDAFSVWFRSNSRNFQLLENHAGSLPPRPIIRWLATAGVIALVLTMASATLCCWLLLRSLAQHLTP